MLLSNKITVSLGHIMNLHNVDRIIKMHACYCYLTLAAIRHAEMDVDRVIGLRIPIIIVTTTNK